jgi:hypothetical protein
MLRDAREAVAGFVLRDSADDSALPSVISLGTGTRCIFDASCKTPTPRLSLDEA